MRILTDEKIKYSSSFLFTPALSRFDLARGQQLGADVSVYDLEDSVPFSQKKSARHNLISFFSERKNFTTAIRLNSIRTDEGQRDLLFLSKLRYLPDIIFLSKAQAQEEIHIVNEIIQTHHETLPHIIAIIEGALGLSNINEIAHACAGLIFGSADYSADVELEMTWKNLLHVRRIIADVTAAHNIIAIDTAYFDIHDSKGLEEECIKLKEIGFHAKAAIHTNQIEIINKIFSPTPDEIKQAQEIIEKYKEKGGGISVLRTSMIGPPFVLQAEKVLKRAAFRGLI